ncbi:unnamed protein product [Diamesa serratosioi]
MLKHVHISPLRNRSDSISLRSTSSSSSCASSICGSPEPPNDSHTRTPSRASSYSSLNESVPQTTLKIYTACLRLDIEYKTLGVPWDTTARHIVSQLLRRCKMRHRDPRLFYLSMEVRIRRASARTMLALDENARPAMLQACHPTGESRFHLQMKTGGLIRVHTSALQPTSQYKSLLISEQTTSDELLGLLLTCYNSIEPVEQFSLYEVCPDQEYQRKLHADDLPLLTQLQRNQKGENCHFLVRRNPNFSRRLLMSLNEQSTVKYRYSLAIPSSSVTDDTKSSTTSIIINDMKTAVATTATAAAAVGTSTTTTTKDINNNNNILNNTSKADTKNTLLPKSSSFDCYKNSTRTTNDNIITNNINNNNNNHHNTTTTTTTKSMSNSSSSSSLLHCQCIINHHVCNACNRQKVIKSFQELTLSTTSTTLSISKMQPTSTFTKLPATSSYNPVYNIREIRTVGNSFSSLGSDKKLMDIDVSSGQSMRTITNRRHSMAVDEAVNSNPSLGIGNFVYI